MNKTYKFRVEGWPTQPIEVMEKSIGISGKAVGLPVNGGVMDYYQAVMFHNFLGKWIDWAKTSGRYKCERERWDRKLMEMGDAHGE